MNFVERHAFELGMGFFTFHMTFLFIEIYLTMWGLTKGIEGNRFGDTISQLYTGPIILRCISLALFTLYMIVQHHQNDRFDWKIILFLVVLNTAIFVYTFISMFELEGAKGLIFYASHVAFFIFYSYISFVALCHICGNKYSTTK